MIRLFRAKQVDGLIIAPTVRSGEEIRRLVDESFPSSCSTAASRSSIRIAC